MSITGDGTNFSTEPIMGLRTPTWGVCGPLGVEPPGLSWGELLGANFGVLAQHTHAPGFGPQVPSAGLAINADVPWNSNNITGLRSARFSALSSLGSLGVSDLGCLVVAGEDLYYVDTNGNQIQMTSGGNIAGALGSIGGLDGIAAITYIPPSKLFRITSSSQVVAGITCGPLILGDPTVANGNAATLKVPAGLASNYTMTLPTALPGSNALLSLSTAGQLSAFGVVNGSRLTLSDTFTVTTAGSGNGITVTGGSTSGTGGKFTGGSTNGLGVEGHGVGTGDGGQFVANGVSVVTGASRGLYAQGASGGPGGEFKGGPTNGIGIISKAQGTGDGGQFLASGVSAVTGSSRGLYAQAANNGAGIEGQGAGTGSGATFTGGLTNGRGAVGKAQGTGDGGVFLGAGVSAPTAASRGLYAQAASNGHGVEAVGAGTGVGGKFTPGGSTTTAIDSLGDVRFFGSNPLPNTGFTNTLTALNTPKAWGNTAHSGSTQILQDGFNISSISTTSTDIIVNFQNPMSNPWYAVIATSTGGNFFVASFSYSISGFTLRMIDAAGSVINPGVVPSIGLSFVVLGRQS